MFDWLFNTEGFSPLGVGSAWSPTLAFVCQFSVTVVFMCYLLLPFGCLRWHRFVMQGLRPRFETAGLILLCLSISSGGLSFLAERLLFHWPAYRVYAVVVLLCATFSFATLIWMAYSLGGFVRGIRRTDPGAT